MTSYVKKGRGPKALTVYYDEFEEWETSSRWFLSKLKELATKEKVTQEQARQLRDLAGLTHVRQCLGCGKLTDVPWPKACPACEAMLAEQEDQGFVAFVRFCSFPALMLGWGYPPTITH